MNRFCQPLQEFCSKTDFLFVLLDSLMYDAPLSQLPMAVTVNFTRQAFLRIAVSSKSLQICNYPLVYIFPHVLQYMQSLHHSSLQNLSWRIPIELF